MKKLNEAMLKVGDIILTTTTAAVTHAVIAIKYDGLKANETNDGPCPRNLIGN